MEDFFGGSLLIKDAFSSTLTQFTDFITKASSGFKMFTNAIGEGERANKAATQNMKSAVMSLAAEYKKSGMSASEAMTRAWKDIEKPSFNTGNKWADAFLKIKQAGTDAFSGISNKMQSFSNSTLGIITKLTAGFISIRTATEGLKTGFGTAMQYQDSRITLNALYGNKNVAGEKFKMATDFANSTPWEEGETIKTLVKLKAYNLDDSKKTMTLMSDLGATFRSSGKNINDATEAYADMMNGEWERMTEFGIKRTRLEQFAKDNGLKAFDNKKGQITDRDALSNVFEAYMNAKNYTGMTEELEKTASGRLSTMTGNLKKSLAELVGITEEGGVRTGSLFEKFINGMEDFITKMNQFTKTENFNKISNALGDIGGAISTGFSYLMEHPEIASDLVKLSVGLWALGKVGSIIGTFSTIVGAFSGGGALASLTPALAPIAPYVLAAVGTFIQLRSVLSPDGILHKSISWLLGKIPLVGDSLQSMFEDLTSGINEFFYEALEGWKIILGFNSSDNKKDTYVDDNSPWYEGKYAKAEDKLQYKTASDLVKEGSITKSSSNAYNNKTEVNFNIEKVEKTADIDEFMDEAVKRIDKHAQTRNNLED